MSTHRGTPSRTYKFIDAAEDQLLDLSGHVDEGDQIRMDAMEEMMSEDADYY